MQAAGLGADAAVSASSADEGTHVALTGMAKAQCAVNENLNLYRGAMGNFTDLLNVKLARQDSACYAKLGSRLNARDAVNAHLCAGMKRHIR